MPKIAHNLLASRPPLPATWRMKNIEDTDPAAFIGDRAERIATLCVPTRCTVAPTDRAVPLQSDSDDQALHRADGQIVVQQPSAEARGLSLYTDDGHLRPLVKIEADLIRLAVQHYGGRMTEIARRLNISRSTLYRKLDAYQIAYTPE